MLQDLFVHSFLQHRQAKSHSNLRLAGRSSFVSTTTKAFTINNRYVKTTAAAATLIYIATASALSTFIRRRPAHQQESALFKIPQCPFLVRASSSNDSTTTKRTMSTYTTLRDNGTITVAPKNEADQSALIVIAHGLGDSAEGFVDVAEHFAKQMPYVKFILPTAPTQPVTMNMGMAMPSWYDIKGLDERSNESCNGLPDSVARITNILQNEHTTTGLPYNRMVLAGFSQGGALSLYTGFTFSSTIAGIVCLSGYLPAAKTFKITPGNENIPVLHCHGTQDMVVAYPLAQKSKVKVQEAGCTEYTIRSYPIGHTVDMKELSDVLEFIKVRLPPDDTCKVKVKDVQDMSVKELKEAIRKAGLTNKAKGLMEKSEFVRLLQDYRDGKL